MSVLRMIIADDRHYLCCELHGSCAEWVYAACSGNPKTLDELDKLLPEFGADANLRELCMNHADFEFEPIDAGLIIVDLAKKWIFAEDSYFGAHRRGSYQTRGAAQEETIVYEFSKDWQFVAEARWFQYLHSCNLKPFGNLDSDSVPEYEINGELDWESMITKAVTETQLPDRENEDEGDEYIRDEELSNIDIEYTNRWCSLIYFEPENEAEQQELKVLEHFLRYDQQAAVAQHRIKKAHEKIFSLRIELQAVENLWKRTNEPRWGLKRIHFQARIGQQEKRISRLAEEHSNAATMATELRTFLTLKKYCDVLQAWEEGKTGDLFEKVEDIDAPF